jgi:hypothetical protein
VGERVSDGVIERVGDGLLDRVGGGWQAYVREYERSLQPVFSHVYV